ncbi:alkaline phosphatase [Natronoglycomyces albus]|uniref:Alkaline phosphatase n=1 Tax=Natronoglycomyces albus TaxID=2811108 RepID=A0A895XRI2_9ACTN|nr:alkaline phosphatase [Natronoglycomyces albus]QSB06133.1 alkaline phosphatase [Natronoglycomyces albus]
MSDENRTGTHRRTLLKASTATAAASAVFVGSGSYAAAQPRDNASEVAHHATTKPRGRGDFRSQEAHANTGRTKPQPRRPQRGRNGSGDIGVTILPIDLATFRAGSLFDLRVEVRGVNPINARVELDIAGPDLAPAAVLSSSPERSAGASDEMIIEYRNLTYPSPGEYTVKVRVTHRGQTLEESVVHTVHGAGAGGAKNVIFFLGDGMGQAPITAARILSKGISEGKYHGLLHMDQMEYRGFVGTSGADALATDSANSMSAYMCGHKSSVNAMGVYESSEEDPNAHPRVETMAELLKRTRGMSVGVVTTSEIQDATPAAVWAHTRRRSEYLEIMDQALNETQAPDVIMGGGMASLLPQSQEGSRREDDRDLRIEFEDLGYAYASTRSELADVIATGPDKVLATFHPGNLNVYLDREHSVDEKVLGEWTDQPNLKEMTEAALEVLQRNENGFFLMVEGASIDKMSHPMDGPRAIYDTIEFDQALGVAKEWAQGRDDTLIIVTADHNHSMSIVGTHDANDGGERDANGVYGNASFPTYADTNGDGFPDDPQPEVSLFYGWSNHPDHTDDFQHNGRFKQPALLDEDGVAVPNPERDPDSPLQQGNLPLNQTNCVHTVDDVPLFASGPGSARFNSFLDNTEVFHLMIDALGIDATDT